MHEGIYQRVQLLLSQGRYKEAEDLLRNALEESPTDPTGRYMLAVVLFYKGESRDAEKICLQLQEEYPENSDNLALMAEINIKEDEYEAANSKIDFLLTMNPESARFYNMKARVKMLTNYYDSALKWTNKALEVDPENMEALNMKSTLADRLGDVNVAANSVLEALEQDPNDPYTMANHGRQLLSQGKHKEALERVSEALRLQPTNALAQYVMQEALKSRFWLYRLFHHYFKFMRKLTARGSWTFIIGAYVVYMGIRNIAQNNPSLSPFLMPVVYILLAFFLLSWIINPLMNLYLLTNPYGKLLLDKEEKTMARFCGGSLALALVSAGVFFITNNFFFALAGIFFMMLMIPLGSFLTPYKESQKRTLTYATIGITLAGLVGIALGQELLISSAFIGIFIYQFLVNGMAISQSSRKME